MPIKIEKIEKKMDNRGFLVQYLTRTELKSEIFGTLYMVTFAPNSVRACHYHKEKREYLFVAYGKCKIVLENVQTKKRTEFTLDSSDDKVIRITVEPFVAHGIMNLSSQVSVVIGYANREYVPNNTDTYFYQLNL